MLHTIKSYLPVFTGFYGTIFEADEEPMIEDGYTYDNYKWDYKGYNEAIGKRCTNTVSEWLKESGFQMVLKFDGIYSPREYNFTNDSINVDYVVSDYCLAKIRAFLHSNKPMFEKYLKDNFSSRSGFYSFYSNEMNEWLGDGKESDWINDLVRFGAILQFILSTDSDYSEGNLYCSCGDIYIDSELINETVN